MNKLRIWVWNHGFGFGTTLVKNHTKIEIVRHIMQELCAEFLLFFFSDGLNIFLQHLWWHLKFSACTITKKKIIFKSQIEAVLFYWISAELHTYRKVLIVAAIVSSKTINQSAVSLLIISVANAFICYCYLNLNSKGMLTVRECPSDRRLIFLNTCLWEGSKD